MASITEVIGQGEHEIRVRYAPGVYRITRCKRRACAADIRRARVSKQKS